MTNCQCSTIIYLSNHCASYYYSWYADNDYYKITQQTLSKNWWTSASPLKICFTAKPNNKTESSNFLTCHRIKCSSTTSFTVELLQTSRFKTWHENSCTFWTLTISHLLAARPASQALHKNTILHKAGCSQHNTITVHSVWLHTMCMRKKVLKDYTIQPMVMTYLLQKKIHHVSTELFVAC